MGLSLGDTVTEAPPSFCSGHCLTNPLWVGGWHRPCVALWMLTRVMRPSSWAGLEMADPLVPLLDILKNMYIKAEFVWLGRCQPTFI